jgi:hypothetical protein
MAEETEQVTLDDLLPLDYVKVHPLDDEWEPVKQDHVRLCTRCGGVVGEGLEHREVHERWHAAIENLTVTQTDQPAPRVDESDRCLHVAQALDREFRRQWNAGRCTVADQTEWRSMARAAMDVLDNAEVEACRVALVTALEHPAEDTTFEQAVELVETLIYDRKYCRKHHADVSQGETNRLRRVEDALVKAGAPNRSERGDPGGLVVRWIERQVQRMNELREENKAAGRAIEALADRVPQGVYTEAVNRVTELEKQLAAVPKSVREMHQDLVEALGLDQNTPFYEALDVARKQAIELAAWHGIQDANAVLNKRSSTVTTVDPGGHRVTVHMDPALPEDWQQQIAVIVANPPATSEVITRIAYWLGVGKVHTCEALCSLEHVEEGLEQQAGPVPPRCVAHGNPSCDQCGLNPADCGSPSDRAGCTTYLADGVHWDTCPNRVQIVHDNGTWELTTGESIPAEAEVCPSLYLWHDTDDNTYELLECKYTKGHPTGWDHKSIDGGHWDNRDAVPSPWPLDQEPPAGINTLVDTGTPADRCQYLRRHPAGWYWSSALGELNMTRSWAEVTVSVEGDLMVVRP